MATNLDIIKRAMKKIHVLASGAEPTSTQAADALASLQSLVVELIGQGSLGRLTDVLATSDYTAHEFERIQASTGVTITIPDTITPVLDIAEGGVYDYGFRNTDVTNSSNRPPYDRACIVVVQDGVATYAIWNSYVGEWVEVQAMTQQGAFPFAAYLEDGFAALLAERLSEDYAQELGPMTRQQANYCRTMLSSKRDSAATVTPSEHF